MFNLLLRTKIEKVANENGWEIPSLDDEGRMFLSSARHERSLVLTALDDSSIYLEVDIPNFFNELVSSVSVPTVIVNDKMRIHDLDDLGSILRRASELGLSLPDSPLKTFEHELEVLEDKEGLSKTERYAEVKQRIGQNIYRQALMEYWGGACAVTGINIPQVLRASHAKPWAACESDAERLSVYNGFLLSANLDALFDCGLISFTDEGEMMVSGRVSLDERVKMGIEKGDSIVKITREHRIFLEYHRNYIFNQ